MATTEEETSQEKPQEPEAPKTNQAILELQQGILRDLEQIQASERAPRKAKSIPSIPLRSASEGELPDWDFRTTGQQIVEGYQKPKKKDDSFYPPLNKVIPPDPVLLDKPQATVEEEKAESPQIYGTSDTPPPGWNPSPEEISRLVEEGFLSGDPRETKKLERVWKAGQASLEDSRGASWFNKASGQALIEEVRSGESAIQKAMWGSVPDNARVVRGDIVIDTAKMYQDTLETHRRILMEKLGRPFSSLSEEEQKEFHEEARKNTQISMATFMHSGGRMYFTDRFDRDITKEIKNSSGLSRIWKVFTSPTKYGAVGVDFPDTHEGDMMRMQAIYTPGQLKTENILSKFGRISLSTLMTPMVFGGHEWMSEEYIDAIRAGDELILHIGDIAGRLEDSPIFGSTSAKWTAGVGTGAIIVGEPDILSLAMAPIGYAAKAAKTAKIASIVGKSNRARKTLVNLKKVLEEGATIPEVANKLERYDKAVQEAVQLRALSEWNLNEATKVRGTGGVEEAERIYLLSEGARKKAIKLRKEIDDLVPELMTAEVAHRKALLEVQAAEQELFSAYLQREITEVQKNEFLKAKGLKEEAARKIEFVKDVPVWEQGARNAEKMGSQARKKATSLRKLKANQKLLAAFDAKARELGTEFRHMEEGFEYLPEAKTKAGKVSTGWQIFTEEKVPLGQISRKGKSFRVPMYGQQVRIPTKKGGTALRTVERIEIRGPKTRKLSDGNDNRIVLKLLNKKTGDIEEFVHPFRIPKAKAEQLRTKILDFEETYHILTADGGLWDQLTTLDKIADNGEQYAASLRVKGPTGLKVLEFEQAGKNLTEAAARYEKATAAAKLPAADLKKIVSKHAKKGQALVRKEIQAVEGAKMRKVYAKALEDTARGLETWVDTGLKNLGVVGFKSPKNIAKSLRAVSRMSGEDLKNFGLKVSDRKVEEAYRKVSKKNTTFKPQKGGRKKAVVEFDVDGVIQDLITHTGGAEDLRDFLALPQGSALRELVSYAEEGIKIGKKPMIGVRGPRAAAIQRSIREAIHYGEAKKLFTEDMTWGRAINEAWRDLGLENRSSRWNQLKTVAEKFPLMGRKWRGSFKNIPYRVGEYGKDVEEAFKETERLLGRGRNELVEVGRLKEFGASPSARMATWMDYQGDVQLKYGPAQWGVATGLGTPYQKGALEILADRRVDPRLREQAEELLEVEASALRAKLEKRLRGALRKQKVNAEKARTQDIAAGQSQLWDDKIILTDEFIEDAVEAAGYITEELIALVPDGGKSGAPLSLSSVAYMWTGRGQGIDIPREQGLLLMGLTLKFLEDSNTFGPARNVYGEIVDIGFSEKMRKATFAILGRTETDFSRATAFASGGFMTAATIGSLKHRLSRASGLRMSAETAADINRLFMGEIEEIKDMEGALDALNRMGMPFTQKKVSRGAADSKAGVAMGDDLKRFLEYGSDPDRASYIPENLLKELERKAGKIAKELQSSAPATRNQAQQNWQRAVSTYLSLWRGSAVTGLGLPNPRYWSNAQMGDFSQMWEEVGVARAASRSFVNGPTNLPFVGRWLQIKGLYMAERLAGKSGRGQALPGIIDTWLNPQLGRLFQGKKGQFVTKNGDIVTFDEARTWSIEDGVAETFVREELLDMYHRTAKDFDRMGPEMAKWWQDNIYGHASQTQERQRVGLYLQELQLGKTRKEAAETVNRALYDWSHGIAEWEARTISRLMPFWRFWRLRIKQTEAAFLEPFVRPTDEYTKLALKGNTRLARLRQQAAIFPSIPDFVYQDSPHADMTENEKVDMLARQLYPTWADTRPKLGVIPWDPIRRANYLEATGREMTHSMITLPMGSALDGLDMVFALYTGLYLLANETAKSLGYKGADFQNPGDVAARFFEPMLGSMMPLPESALRALLSQNNMDVDFQIRGADRYLSPEEEKVWKNMPGIMPVLGAQLNFDPERGRYKVPQHAYWAWRALPFSTTQLQPWVGAFSAPEWKEGFAQGLWAATKRLTGWGREIPFNVNKELDGRRRDMQREFKEFLKEHQAVNRPYAGPRKQGLPKRLQEDREILKKYYGEDD